ncbi:MAG: hypothetical protein GY929_21580 [Actinomycetia bacterium]|nr:hypothetical protein [Actinomycetes bacterium]
MYRSRSGKGWGRSALALLGLLFAALASIVAYDDLSGSASGASAAVAHGQLVPDSPERGYPIILNDPERWVGDTNCNGCWIPREVFAADQVGDYIVTGGNFHRIEVQDGTVLQQKYFAAWNINTKELVCREQFTFSNEIHAIEPGPSPTQVYVGGRFNTVTGADGKERPRNKVALIDLADCSVDKTFVSTGGNAKVTEIVYTGDRLFVAGDFTSIGGRDVETVAEFDPTTATVNINFGFSTTGELTDRVKGLGVNTANTRLILAGRFGTIAGNGRSITSPTAVIDISDPNQPVLTPHRYTHVNEEWGDRPRNQSFQDASISPDGSTVGMAFGTATESDWVYLVPTIESTTSYRWAHYMRDSSFAIAVGDAAVYVEGHFCKIDSGPGETAVMNKTITFPCTGDFFAGGVFRTQIAALSLADGTPLTWNPGQNASVGGRELTVTERGLLAGFDGDRSDGIRTGALAFYDLGAPTDEAVPSDVSIDHPADDERLQSPITLSGSATDDVGVFEFIFAVRSDGQWLQDNGTIAARYNEFKVGAGRNSFATNMTMPDGDYRAQIKARDAAGNTSVNWTYREFTVGQPTGPACTVTQRGADAVIEWSDMGSELYSIRVDGSWLVTTTGDEFSYTHETADARDTYALRYWAGGRMDLECRQGDGDPPPPDPPCVVAFGEGVVLTWTEIVGEDEYVVRKNGSWLATVNGTLTHTDAAGTAADQYSIRYFADGVHDVECV